jgi:hypothetical protein
MRETGKRIGRLVQIGIAVVFQAPASLYSQATWVQAVDSIPVLRFGEVLGGSEALTLSEITDLAVVGDSILVLEGLANEVRIFNHHGQFLGRIGRTGEGPGEFQWPTRLQRVPEGLEVVDLRLRRQTFFTLEGELLRTEPLGHFSELPLSASVTLRGGSMVAETAVFASSDQGAHPERLILLSDGEGVRVDTLARFAQGYVPFKAPNSFGFLGSHAGAGGDWAVAGDSLLVVVSQEPLVLRWWHVEPDGLVLRGRVELPVRSERFSGEDLRNFIEVENEDRREKGEALLPRSVQVDAPSHWGQVKQVVVSDKDQCWIQWNEPRTEDDRHWFRVDLKTQRLSRMELPPGFRVLAAARGNLYGFVVTEFDAPEIRVYRLITRG